METTVTAYGPGVVNVHQHVDGSAFFPGGSGYGEDWGVEIVIPSGTKQATCFGRENGANPVDRIHTIYQMTAKSFLGELSWLYPIT